MSIVVCRRYSCVNRLWYDWKWKEIISIENQGRSFKSDEGRVLDIYSDGVNTDLGRLYVPASETLASPCEAI